MSVDLSKATFVTVRYVGGSYLKIINDGHLYVEQRVGKTWYGKAYQAITKSKPIKWFWEFKDSQYTGNILVHSKDKYSLFTKAYIRDRILANQI